MRIRHWVLLFFLAILVLFFLGLSHWTSKGIRPASGGWYVPGRLTLQVTPYLQGDMRWGMDRLGETPATLEEEGCAVTSAAMVLSAYGYDVDPGRLNHFVTSEGGYTPEGWLYWEAAAAYPPSTYEKAYEDEASHFLIDWNLLRKNPVIARVRFPNGITHFVVIVGKEGFDYLIQDPGRDGNKGIYPLKELGVPIEAIRYYRKKI